MSDNAAIAEKKAGLVAAPKSEGIKKRVHNLQICIIFSKPAFRVTLLHMEITKKVFSMYIKHRLLSS